MTLKTSAEEIARVKAECKAAGKSFLLTDLSAEEKDWANFLFVGEYKGAEVVYDAFIYTLEMEFFSRVYEDAIKEVIKLNPQYAESDFELEEGRHVELMEDFAQDLCKDEDYQVSEFIETDEDSEYGIAMDICLNQPEINEEVIEKFVKDFTNHSLKMDKSWYSFEFE